jgi:hypothetical protein
VFSRGAASATFLNHLFPGHGAGGCSDRHSTTIAVDVAKSVFEVAVSDRPAGWSNGSAYRARRSSI